MMMTMIDDDCWWRFIGSGSQRLDYNAYIHTVKEN